MSKSPTHHAYLVWQAEPAVDLVLLQTQLHINDLSLEVVAFAKSKIGVGEVVDLRYAAQLRPAIKDFQLITVTVEAITVEAEQALLKLLEDPPPQTIFAFFVRQEIKLLDTLLSRFAKLNAPSPSNDKADWFDFTALKVADRLSVITDKLAAKDTLWVANIKSGLTAHLTRGSKTNPNLKRLEYIMRHLGTRGAGNKMLLEELALSL